VKPEDIRAANNLNDNSIRPGQVLKIGAGSATASVAKADFSKEESEREQETPAAKAPAEAKPAASEDRPGTYTVRKDDTLWKIARQFNLSPDDLRAANGLKSDALRPGQTLTLAKPVKTAAAKTSEGSEKSADSQSVAYTVQDGDTLWKIARLFKVKPDQIKSWNSMTSDDLRPGTVLRILSRAG
jgi:LysM repeat protein